MQKSAVAQINGFQTSASRVADRTLPDRRDQGKKGAAGCNGGIISVLKRLDEGNVAPVLLDDSFAVDLLFLFLFHLYAGN